MKIKDSSFVFSPTDIVQFTTGMPYEPPLGFAPPPTVNFTATSLYPIANTCINVLHLPTNHKSVDEFGWHVCFGRLNSGLGKSNVRYHAVSPLKFEVLTSRSQKI